MDRLRAFFGRLPGRRRPPTGPLTTAEATKADELRQEKLVKDDERKQEEDRPDREA